VTHDDLFKFPRVPHLRVIFHTGTHRWPGMVQWPTICLKNPSVRARHLLPKLPEVTTSTPVLGFEQARVAPVEFRVLNDPEPTSAVFTVSGLVQTGLALAEAFGISSADRVAAVNCPAAFYPLVLGVLHKGAVLVQPYHKFSAAHVLDSIIKDKLTVLFLNYHDALKLVEHSTEGLDLSTLRTVVVVGGITPKLENAIRKKFPVKEVFGLTTVPDISGQLTGLLRVGQGKNIPLPYAEAKVVDESGNTVQVGTVGILKTKGPHVSTAVGGPATWVDKDGWLDTLIQAVMNNDGSFTILPKAKNESADGLFRAFLDAHSETKIGAQ